MHLRRANKPTPAALCRFGLRTPNTQHDVNGEPGRPVPHIQCFGNRQPTIVSPDEIRPGDWLRDLGTLRQVVSADVVPGPSSRERSFLLRFADLPEVENLALTIPETVEAVTVWRAT